MDELLSTIIVTAITALAGIITTIITTRQQGTKTRKQLNDEIEVLKGAQRSSLYFEIKMNCLQCIKQKYIDEDTLEATEEAWDYYHNKLGGNGYLTTLMSKLRELPLTNERSNKNAKR